ncbi:MAG: hypothetical protein KU37_02475 [Sulfuricurvum sp. PC08-66]|nr:MAG: hypothetical protein KU37_02475 [Sulfuricurvum sp. PC08-66]
MALTLRIEGHFGLPILENCLTMLLHEYEVPSLIEPQEEGFLCAMDDTAPRLSDALAAMTSRLPHVLGLSKISSLSTPHAPQTVRPLASVNALGLGLCPSCHASMFDAKSLHFFDPFTRCSCCGGHYALPVIESKNITFDTLQAPATHTYEALFEAVASYIAQGNSVVCKTTFGLRRFAAVTPTSEHIMATSIAKLSTLAPLIESEIQALLSIERPFLRVKLHDQARIVKLKAPDEGFSIALCAKLAALGIESIAIEACEGTRSGEKVLDFASEVSAQEELLVMVRQNEVRIVEGERALFPRRLSHVSHTLGIASHLVAVPHEREVAIDRMERFDQAHAAKVVAIEGETLLFEATNVVRISPSVAASMSLIVEHRLFGSKAVCVTLDDMPIFGYFDGKKMIDVIPSKPFEGAQLLERLGSLREGSDRLVETVRVKLPSVYEVLTLADDHFAATVASILELDEASMEALITAGLLYGGKGGLHIDMSVGDDHRFDPYAAVASLLSYRLAGVSSAHLAYSLMEAWGDFAALTLQTLQGKTAATHLCACGAALGSTLFWGRLRQKVEPQKLLANLTLPMSGNNRIVGAIFG